VAELSRKLDVHPVYLARAFRSAYRHSIREHCRLFHVRRATALVLTTRRSLSDIAHECGFSDHSHMCRAFRAALGMNPASLR
jgi:transcriptional regulator GlxA family with amidase domain